MNNSVLEYIRIFWSEYIWFRRYSTIFGGPNIFVFVFVVFPRAKYIRIFKYFARIFGYKYFLKTTNFDQFRRVWHKKVSKYILNYSVFKYIRIFWSEYIRFGRYSTIFGGPNIFVFVFGHFCDTKYICIRIRSMLVMSNIFVFVFGPQKNICYTMG